MARSRCRSLLLLHLLFLILLSARLVRKSGRSIIGSHIELNKSDGALANGIAKARSLARSRARYFTACSGSRCRGAAPCRRGRHLPAALANKISRLFRRASCGKIKRENQSTRQRDPAAREGTFETGPITARATRRFRVAEVVGSSRRATR